MPSLLLIDRRPRDSVGLSSALAKAGYAVTHIERSELVSDFVKLNRPATILVGRLPTDIFRHEMCALLRRAAPASSTAIIVLAPQATRLTRIRCLEDGADDILDEDMPIDLLTARIRALGAPLSRTRETRILRYGPIEMSIDEHKVHACGATLDLQPTTFQVLRSFLERPEQILSRSELLARSTRIATSRSLYKHVRLLRRALATLGVGDPIITKPPLGYMLSMR
ncbi:hypothetical protein ASE00_12475 [Sphingomonas sp. Root710]|uniref:response regulator transcription factor n=1 Tax=Sphingomonas sp. Root710 TaxID=1736594 RepID=UPI0006F27A03|nr:response regulator transcription factor [Sphingomonas sp. Root710]KRB82828.1 hypothetical protein ASE00_12475 [Sphingomonas sp. Root710]